MNAVQSHPHAPATVPQKPAARSDAARIARAWEILAGVEDPEIPAVSIVDLGLIRFVRANFQGALEVGLSPTYVGCPATEVIRRSVCEALARAALGDVDVSNVLSPAWSSDCISDQGRAKLLAYGIVPPDRSVSTMREVLRSHQPVACPHCQSLDTETVSEFGSTPCKALHRCRACLEPFEYFKCI
ncbi:MAG TPA: 1,2-phenylacetyl-CoA epoxidase subunit PaaD [Steroidobacteraceae bacterium]|nr:1,2-phenylacetyl-CoA epoxidase subunit PaaD [Steroidobacteraceae bacterium]